MIEFVKGDTHGSKAVPPRFKDHTKLVCARHTRSGRKKYVKKYPDRVRKVPSRKLEGTGCPASISYKTYFDTDEVRVCYMSEHSHEIGLANLPFTKRGRKLAAEQQQSRARSRAARESSEASKTPPPIAPLNEASASSGAGPSNQPSQHTSMSPPSAGPPMQTFQTAMSMVPQQPQQPIAQPPPPQPLAPPPPPQPLAQERWDRMSVLFQGIRENARNFEYPAPSVAALESILIRLYLESPMGGGVVNGG